MAPQGIYGMKRHYASKSEKRKYKPLFLLRPFFWNDVATETSSDV
jgi:hypothetical protein